MFFWDRTILIVPLIMSYSDEPRKIQVLKERDACLSNVQGFLDSYLNKNKEKFCRDWTIQQVLNHQYINVDNYYRFLSFSRDDNHINHMCSPNLCLANNYNPVLFVAFQANRDIQAVTNYYKAVSCICFYFSKSESKSSDTIRILQNQKSKIRGYRLNKSNNIRFFFLV